MLYLQIKPHTMFKKKKKPAISGPSNFEHRVHTGFDHNQGRFVGLPQQWQSVVNTEDSSRRRPMVDPSSITPVEIQPLKVKGLVNVFSLNSQKGLSNFFTPDMPFLAFNGQFNILSFSFFNENKSMWLSGLKRKNQFNNYTPAH